MTQAFSGVGLSRARIHDPKICGVGCPGLGYMTHAFPVWGCPGLATLTRELVV